MDGLADLRCETALAIGDLHNQPVVGRQAHMDIDQRAEIGHEFHRTRQAVVESGRGKGADFDPFGPQRQHGAPDLAVVNGRVGRTKLTRPEPGVPAALGPFWSPYAERNQLFANDGKYEKKVYTLPKFLDEKVARLHLDKIGVKLTKLNDKQSEYLGLPVQGPYKPDQYRY